MKKDQILFLPIGSKGAQDEVNKIYIEENHPKDNRIVLFQHDKNNNVLEELPNDDKIVVSWSTITSAIHLAAYMGLKILFWLVMIVGRLTMKETIKDIIQKQPWDTVIRTTNLMRIGFQKLKTKRFS